MELGNKVNNWIANTKRNFLTSVRFLLHNSNIALPKTVILPADSTTLSPDGRV